jgi:hypothetical protein
VKFITLRFSPWSFFLPFESKYPPQHFSVEVWFVYDKSEACGLLSVWRNYLRICLVVVTNTTKWLRIVDQWGHFMLLVRSRSEFSFRCEESFESVAEFEYLRMTISSRVTCLYAF